MRRAGNVFKRLNNEFKRNNNEPSSSDIVLKSWNYVFKLDDNVSRPATMSNHPSTLWRRLDALGGRIFRRLEHSTRPIRTFRVFRGFDRPPPPSRETF